MLKLDRIFASILLVTLWLANAQAQSDIAKNENRGATTVTASASGDHVRFAASPSVVQIRLEVYDSAGKKLFDNELRGGNVLDWHVQDGQAEPLPDDSYLCVVTVKNLSGKLTQSIGSVIVERTTARVQPVDVSQMTPQQSQAIGPVEENASLTVLKEDEYQTTTVIAHNGEEGQIIRGRGALSFRVGDFFSGKDTEQMRLTPEGNLGIGIAHPQVRLDVDGFIRASQGIMFPDGTIQTTAAIAAGSSQGITGQPQIGPGSKPIKLGKASSGNRKGQNTVSPETLINDDLTVNGSIFFTTGFPRDLAMLNNTGGVRIYSASTLTNSPASAAIQFFGTGSAFTGQAFIDSGAHDNAAVVFRTAPTGGTIAERMRITSTGNIGIGTNSPSTKLEISGNALLYPASGPGTLLIRNRTNSDYSQVAFMDDTNTYRGYIGYIGANALPPREGRNDTVEFGTNGKTMTFRPNEAEVMRLTTSGNVGIGTNNPTSKLHVSGTGIIRALVDSDSNAGFGLALNNQAKWSMATTSGEFQIYNDALSGNALFIDGSTNNVAIGTNPSLMRLSIEGSRGLYVNATPGNYVGEFATGTFAIDSSTDIGGRLLVMEDSTVKINNPSTMLTDTSEKLIVNGVIRAKFGTGVGSPLCTNNSQEIAVCNSSSIRYKENVNNFTPGLNLISRLRPVSFNWKQDGARDVGLVAEEVAKVEPLLITHNEKNEIEGVKYDRIAVVLLNAVKEQQAQIQTQQREIEMLKKLACSRHSTSTICKPAPGASTATRKVRAMSRAK